ncbi:MAG: ABC transporter permease [Nitrospinota bacterium]
MEAGAGRSDHIARALNGGWPRLRAGFVKYSPVLILCAIWQVLSLSGLVHKDLLPSFIEVVGAWFRLLLSGDLIVHSASSLWREATGFSLSVLFGTTTGIAMARYRPFREFFQPLISLLFPVPKSALIPILIVWLGIGHMSKIAVIFLACILPITVSSFNGARGADKFLIWSALNLGTSQGRLLWKVIIPSALPDMMSGIRLALAVSFVLLVSSEMLAGNSGIGFLIFYLGEGGDYSGMFAAIITLTLMGFLADRLYLKVMRRALVWHYSPEV